MTRSVWDWNRETARRINPGGLRQAQRIAQRHERLEPIVAVAIEGWRWVAARTEAFQERRVKRDLIALGFNAYCPLGMRFVNWLPGRHTHRKIKRQFPAFARYLFVGCPPGVGLGKHTVDKIEAVLSDRAGATPVPGEAIRQLNELELAGFWDETRPDSERSIFKPGAPVTIKTGPFAWLAATVEAVESEEKIRVLVSIFGRQTPVSVQACQIERARL